jgi:glycine cleavage system aminomethyltransferase T
MAKIEFRYRDYKDPRLRGTWMLVNGKQIQRISYRQLSRKEIAQFRKTHILTEKGYIQKDKHTYQKQEGEDHIREVKLGDLHDEVSDIERDPATKKWTKEKVEDREYADPENPEELDKVV